MNRTHLAVFVAAIALGGSSLAAQQVNPAVKKGTVQHDSLKTVKKTIKSDKVARKAAKAKGDTATAKALKKQIKAEKKTKAALKAETTKTTPKKKP
jgi:flagellar biogenesis protein FliO